MKKHLALAAIFTLGAALTGCGSSGAITTDATAFSAAPAANVSSESLFAKPIKSYVDNFMSRYDTDKDGKISIGKKVLGSWGALDAMALKENTQLHKESLTFINTNPNGKVTLMDLQPLLAAADADKDGFTTAQELTQFIKATFDRNNNDELGLFERIRFRFSAFHERSKSLSAANMKDINGGMAEVQRRAVIGNIAPLEDAEDVDKTTTPTAEEQAALNS